MPAERLIHRLALDTALRSRLICGLNADALSWPIPHSLNASINSSCSAASAGGGRPMPAQAMRAREKEP